MFMHLQSPPETASGPASVVSSRRRRPPCLRPVVVALAAALGWGTALAQEGTDQADGQVAGSASQLGTVHVREQAASAAFRAGEAEFGPLGRRPVQALPYSVQVIPETLIEDQQASSLTDLLKYMPSAQMQARGGADVGRPQTRGMQSSVVANNHLDGLNVVGTTAYPMEQLAGLEVIQSLTGAFYGPASPAGNFNFISKRPTERPLRRLTLGYVSDARLGLHADLSGAVDANQVLRYRTNLLQEEGEGYVRDSKVRRRLASVALDVHPRAGTVIELNASQYRFVRNGFAGSFSYSADVPLPDAPDPTRVGYGRPVRLPARIGRIATTWEAQNAIVAMLGFGDRIVATTRHVHGMPVFRRFVPGIAQAVIAGDGERGVNLETLYSVHPDILFVAGETDEPSAHRAQLEAVGIAVAGFRYGSLEAIVERTRLTADMLGGEAPRRARAYEAHFRHTMARLARRIDRIPAARRVTVYHAMGSPLASSGCPSLNQDWMDAAGAINVAERWPVSGQDRMTVSIERLLAADPDVIVVMIPGDAEAIRNDSRWQGMRAVKNGRILVNPRGMFWWCRETCEAVLQPLWLASQLYPEMFTDIDMRTETRDFYHRFFGYRLSDADVTAFLHPAA